MDSIDARLHAERVEPGSRLQRRYVTAFTGLPSGAFVLHNNVPFLVDGDRMVRWTAAGYEAPIARPTGRRAIVLTPPSLVEVLRSGWEPAVPLLHPSAFTRG